MQNEKKENFGGFGNEVLGVTKLTSGDKAQSFFHTTPGFITWKYSFSFYF